MIRTDFTKKGKSSLQGYIGYQCGRVVNSTYRKMRGRIIGFIPDDRQGGVGIKKPKYTVLMGNIYKSTEKDEFYNRCIWNTALEHVPETGKALRASNRTLKETGILRLPVQLFHQDCIQSKTASEHRSWLRL